MLKTGDKVRFSTDSKGPEAADVFTVEAVSAHVDMVQIEGGWMWLDNIVLVEPAKPAEPDALDDQLTFLGL